MSAIRATFAWLLLMNGNCLPESQRYFVVCMCVCDATVVGWKWNEGNKPLLCKVNQSCRRAPLALTLFSVSFSPSLSFATTKLYLWLNVDSLFIVVNWLHVFINSVALFPFEFKSSIPNKNSWLKASAAPRFLYPRLYCTLAWTWWINPRVRPLFGKWQQGAVHVHAYPH